MYALKLPWVSSRDAHSRAEQRPRKYTPEYTIIALQHTVVRARLSEYSAGHAPIAPEVGVAKQNGRCACVCALLEYLRVLAE